MKKKLLLFASLLLMLSACRPGATHIELAQPADENRITIRRIAVVYDDVAYNSHRGVYIIRDNVTEREFIGVSGIGISEISTHIVGKNIHSDER